LEDSFGTRYEWRKLSRHGTRLWFDSGNISEIEHGYTREFDGVTVNNTLLNREIQKGTYDSFMTKVMSFLQQTDLSEHQQLLEASFALSAYHGLRLVEKFDCFVSLEEHTDIANDVELAVDYGERFNEICPERFIVKIPLTPAGIIAAARLEKKGVAVNMTLGFSARQNYIASCISNCSYVNVFLGRLNVFVAESGLGNGLYVGEKTMLASQKAIRNLRSTGKCKTSQIAASFRNSRQVVNLVGVDVMTIPPKVAADFIALNKPADELTNKTQMDYEAGMRSEMEASALGLSKLWEIEDGLVDSTGKLLRHNIESFTPDDFVGFFKSQGFGDIFVKWTNDELRRNKREGKIVKLENWQNALTERYCGLDSLMTMAGLNSFAAAQKEIDHKLSQFVVVSSK
jgi:transaldolase